MTQARKRVVVLYSEVMGYTEALLRELASTVDLIVYHQCASLKTPHRLSACEGVAFRAREEMSAGEVKEMLRDPRTLGVFSSGWNHRPTRRVLRSARRLGVPTVIGLDNHWRGSIRQRLGAWTAPVTVRRLAGGLFVAGPEQYEFGRRLGFPRDRIELGLYSADNTMFGSGHRPAKVEAAERTLLFVGRLVDVKGILPFARTFSRLAEELSSPWELRVVGNGPLEGELSSLPRVRVLGFLPPEEVNAELRGADAFVLPSLHEPWGVVVHEAALAGLPLLVSHDVGAARRFVVSGLNGSRFETRSEAGRESAVRELIGASTERLMAMGAASARLGQSYSVKECAARLLSLLARQGS